MKKKIPPYSYLGCAATKARVPWCYGLCKPIDGKGQCGRLAPHTMKSSTQRAIENYKKGKEKENMKETHTEIVVILDRSGSMNSIRDDAIGGFNAFIEEQKDVPGTATVTFVQFDDKYEMVYTNKPIEDVKPLDETTYVPRGSTALLDAIGRTVVGVAADIEAKDAQNRPEKVLVAILTDGAENASKEFKKDQIVKAITERTDAGWEFIYLSSDVDAFRDATDYGVKINNVFIFEKTKKGVDSAYKHMSGSTTTYRTN